jgi:TRAP-type C4-dicarboxylate transport system substrate-binding protein
VVVLRRGLVALGAVLLLAGCSARRWPDREQVGKGDRIVMKFSHAAAENTAKGQAARLLAALVKQRTAGKVEVQVYPNAGLYTEAEEIAALRDGTVQMIAPSMSELATVDPAWAVFDLPYLFADSAAAERLIAGNTGQQLYSNLRGQGLEPVAMWYDGLKQLTNAKHSVLLPDDLRGLRLSSDINLLMTGGVDGQENTATNIYAKRLYEVQPYMTVSNHRYQGYIVLLNGAFWNELPPPLRETVREALADTTQWVRENADRMNAEALAKIEASGHVLIHQQTPNERELWRHAMSPAFTALEERVGADFVQLAMKEASGQ